MALSNIKNRVSKVVIAVVLVSLLIPTTTNAAGRAGDVVNTIRSGSGVPSVSLGTDGDFYIDLKSMNIYGPKKISVGLCQYHCVVQLEQLVHQE